jgi:cupin 2 domain-containing protein
LKYRPKCEDVNSCGGGCSVGNIAPEAVQLSATSASHKERRAHRGEVTIRVQNLFANLPELSGSEASLGLFETPSIKIQRIVSQSYSSPPGFWYDQDEDEWVIVVRGEATLEFEAGDLVRMKEGDYVTIPRHVKHRIQQTDPRTIWLAVHIH